MVRPDREIRAQLQQYLLGEDDLRAFQRWFMPVAWQAGEDRNPTKLIRAIELYLAEYTNGHRTEPELRSIFLAMLPATLTLNRSEGTTWAAETADFSVR